MKKVCRHCRIFVKGNECQICHGKNISDSWQGRISMLNVEKSRVAKETGITNNGEYVIKVR